MRNLLFTFFGCVVIAGCSTTKIKDIAYARNESDTKHKTLKLNVFLPKKPNEKLPVLIFMHGGNWNTGNKNTYGFYGRNFAQKGVIVVVPDYTLSPDADYDVMATQTAAAIKWTKAEISKYGGDPNRIFVTGHSAGGHLAALAVMNPKYGIANGTVSGIILNDAAGLDMKHYLESDPPTQSHDYLATWSNDPAKWQDASPIYFIDGKTPPVLVYIGKKRTNRFW